MAEVQVTVFEGDEDMETDVFVEGVITPAEPSTGTREGVEIHSIKLLDGRDIPHKWWDQLDMEYLAEKLYYEGY